jgi:hypothetical protein
MGLDAQAELLWILCATRRLKTLSLTVVDFREGKFFERLEDRCFNLRMDDTHMLQKQTVLSLILLAWLKYC